MKRGSSQGLVHQGTRPHPSPASDKDSSPRTNSRIARGSPRSADTPPSHIRLISGELCRAATSSESPYQPTVSHPHLLQGSHDTLSLHACLSRQCRSDRSHFAPLL